MVTLSIKNGSTNLHPTSFLKKKKSASHFHWGPHPAPHQTQGSPPILNPPFPTWVVPSLLPDQSFQSRRDGGIPVNWANFFCRENGAFFRGSSSQLQLRGLMEFWSSEIIQISIMLSHTVQVETKKNITWLHLRSRLRQLIRSVMAKQPFSFHKFKTSIYMKMSTWYTHFAGGKINHNWNQNWIHLWTNKRDSPQTFQPPALGPNLRSQAMHLFLKKMTQRKLKGQPAFGKETAVFHPKAFSHLVRHSKNRPIQTKKWRGIFLMWGLQVGPRLRRSSNRCKAVLFAKKKET